MIRKFRVWFWHYRQDVKVLRPTVGVVRAAVAVLKLSLAQRFLRRGSLLTLPADRKRASVQVRNGTSDIEVYRQHFFRHELEGFELESPSLILDGGGNIGLAAVRFAMRYPKARILTIEPDSENFSLLRRNLQKYSGQITAVNGAIWKRTVGLRIDNPTDEPWAFQVVESEDGEIDGYSIVDLSTLFCSGMPFDLVKLDIEGAEREVFEGDTKWTMHSRLVGVELHERFRPGCSDSVRAAFDPSLWELSESGEYVVFKRRV